MKICRDCKCAVFMGISKYYCTKLEKIKKSYNNCESFEKKNEVWKLVIYILLVVLLAYLGMK